MRKKLILDLDTGIDDALAIAYALGSAGDADLIGITATYGNVAVPLAAAMRLRCSTHLDAMTYRCIPASTIPSHPRSCH